MVLNFLNNFVWGKILFKKNLIFSGSNLGKCKILIILNSWKMGFTKLLRIYRPCFDRFDGKTKTDLNVELLFFWG